ncbi:DUF916 and DUF3324 domain-containing protein [Enterococcus rivorum]
MDESVLTKFTGSQLNQCFVSFREEKGLNLMNKKAIIYFILYITCLGFFPQVASAEQAKEDPLDSGTFSYKVIHPENQLSAAGYFDLRMKPSQKQTVEIELRNPSESKEVTVNVSLNSTKTNANGVLEYGPAAIEKDQSMKYAFEDIVKAEEKVTIPPGKTVPLKLKIEMPAETFDGYISGGIQLKVELTEAAKKARAKQKGISNDYAFLIGMLLTETDHVVEPDLKFNKIYADLANYRNAIFANFSNTTTSFVKDMTIDMQIMEKGSKEVLYDTKKADMRMAPNSMIDFPVLMNGDSMKPGDYTGHIIVTSGEKKWEWTEHFKITQEEAEKYNKQDVSLIQEQGINWKVVIAIVIGIILLLVLIFVSIHFVNKRNKQKKQLQRKTLKQKKQRQTKKRD